MNTNNTYPHSFYDMSLVCTPFQYISPHHSACRVSYARNINQYQTQRHAIKHKSVHFCICGCRERLPVLIQAAILGLETYWWSFGPWVCGTQDRKAVTDDRQNELILNGLKEIEFLLLTTSYDKATVKPRGNQEIWRVTVLSLFNSLPRQKDVWNCEISRNHLCIA